MTRDAERGRRRRAAVALERAVGLLASGDRDGGRRALRSVDPRDLPAVPALLRYAFAALGVGEDGRALDAARLAAASDPREPRAHLLLGVALRRRGEFREALAAFDAAVALRPGRPDALANRALTLEDLDRFEEAADAALAGLEAAPDDPDLLNVAGSALLAEGDTAGAIRAWRRLVEVERGAAWARFNLATALLAAGRFEEGWQAYEARLELRPEDAFPPTRAPRLRPGDAVAGRTVLCWHEQGFGDTVMACRYLAMLAGRGADIVVRAPQPLVRLLGRLDAVRTVVAPDAPLPGHDVQLPMMSLPLICDPALEHAAPAVPYLHAEPDAEVAARRAREAGPLVGVAWAGRPGHAEDRRRSIPAEALEDLFAVRGVTFVSLQPDRRPPAAAEGRLVAPDPPPRDLAALAAVIAGLDVVVSADTAAAHVAGALGIPLLLLLPRPAEWRWGTEGTATRWYPTATLLRQPRPGDWAAVIAEAAARLGRIARAGGGESRR
ncbi:MAG: tetratricopeptide repeat protein [Acidobacteriota bacterium]